MPGFAPISQDLSYWQKQKQPLFADLTWNIPEQKTGHIAVIGGNSQNFSSVIRTAEFVNRTFPLKQVTTLLPDSLRSQVPASENIAFAPATSSGTFTKSYDLRHAIESADFALLAGDLSRNAETAIAISDAIKDNTTPLLATRDTLDLLAPTAEQLLNREHVFIVGSMAQLQKIFRTVYYPRMIMLSQPLVPIIETLHKFTLSYPTTILTFHEGNIIVASGGQITTTHIENTSYSPLTLWSGQLAGKISALNLFNPGKPLEATTAAILYA